MTNHPNRSRRWTQDNTSGFTDGQLAVINGAIAIIRSQHPGVDRSNLDAAINNAWNEQDTAEALAKDALEHI